MTLQVVQEAEEEEAVAAVVDLAHQVQLCFHSNEDIHNIQYLGDGLGISVQKISLRQVQKYR